MKGGFFVQKNKNVRIQGNYIGTVEYSNEGIFNILQGAEIEFASPLLDSYALEGREQILFLHPVNRHVNRSTGCPHYTKYILAKKLMIF